MIALLRRLPETKLTRWLWYRLVPYGIPKKWEISRGQWDASVPEGWQKEIVDPFLQLWALLPDEYVIDQIKQKYGTLCVYVSGPPWWRKLARICEREADGRCERCGTKHGQGAFNWLPVVTFVKLGGYVCQLCDRCQAKVTTNGGHVTPLRGQGV